MASAVKRELWKGAQNKGSGQLIQKPVMRAFASYTRRSVTVSLTAAELFAKLFIVGVPFYDVSFRAFTASPTVLKGTPTVQPFDNRSIAQLLNVEQ